MTTIALTDRLLREALAPSPSSTTPAQMAEAVSERTHRTRQVRRPTLPWLLPAAATLADERRVRLLRLALLVSLLAVSAGLAAVGARVLLKPQAPPQILLVQGGIGYSMPLGGGERTRIAALADRDLLDFSLSQDGSKLATLRSHRGILEIWDAAAVLNGDPTTPILYPNTDGLRVADTGAWRPDGRGLLITASEHGARRVFLVDSETGTTTQVSPDGIAVDDWQPSFDGRWIEVAGQYEGHNALFLVDVANGDARLLVGTIGDRIPEGGALGWSPDSRTMTFHLREGLDDLGIWRMDLGGTDLRQVTPPGQPASWMNWSPDGQWLAYETEAADPRCPRDTNRRATWLVRPDGSDAHVLAEGARPYYWAEDSRSVVVDTSDPLPGAPLGGVMHVFLDGSPSTLVYAYAATDVTGTGCYPYEIITKFYRGMGRGLR